MIYYSNVFLLYKLWSVHVNIYFTVLDQNQKSPRTSGSQPIMSDLRLISPFQIWTKITQYIIKVFQTSNCSPGCGHLRYLLCWLLVRGGNWFQPSIKLFSQLPIAKAYFVFYKLTVWNTLSILIIFHWHVYIQNRRHALILAIYYIIKHQKIYQTLHFLLNNKINCLLF